MLTKGMAGGLLVLMNCLLMAQACAANPLPELPMLAQTGEEKQASGSTTVELPSASPRLQISGHLETGLLHQQQRAHTLLNPQGQLVSVPSLEAETALRLRPSWKDSERVQFRADAWLTLQRDSQHQAPAQRNYLSEALLEVQLGSDTILSAGINTLKWGTGYSWNPSNPLADPKSNLTDRALSYYRDGDPYLGIESGDFRSRWTAFVSHSKGRDPSTGGPYERTYFWGVRKQFMLEASDLLLAYTAAPGIATVGAAYSATMHDQLELHAELGISNRRRYMPVTRIQVEAPAGAETLYQLQPRLQDKRVTQLLLGGQYTWADQTNLIVEYLYNGAGASQPEYAALLAAAHNAAQQAGSSHLAAAHHGFLASAHHQLFRMRRHYGFARLYKKMQNDVELGSYLRYGWDDNSFLQGFYVSTPLSPAVALRVHAEYYGGASNSETRLIPTRYQGSAAFIIHF